MNPLHNSILQTLLYYDIFDHPLTSLEIFRFLPTNTVTTSDVQGTLIEMVRDRKVEESGGFYFLPGKPYPLSRLQKQGYARRLWRIARVVTSLIKRFPFVRAVIVSGDLSKNVADKKSDIDFFVITEIRRLWICRAFLTLFKKVFLLNSKKFFCINFYVSADHLEIEERNVYVATEIAHLQPTYNGSLFYQLLQANSWIKDFFPNFECSGNGHACNGADRSAIRTLLEMPFRGKWAGGLDERLMEFMRKVWKRRYPELTVEERDTIFRCRPYESRAHPGNFEEKVLAAYEQRLRKFGIGETTGSSNGNRLKGS